MTDEELIAMAITHHASTITAPNESLPYSIRFDPERLRAFASALRQQDLARMARMREALEKAQTDSAFDELHQDTIDATYEALFETSDIQEWMDGQRATVPDEARFFPFEFEVWQDDEMVASASGPRDDALREAMNYAAQYEQDGPVRIFEVNRWLIDAPSARSTKGEGKSDAGAQMLMPRLLPESPLPPNPVRIDDKCNKEKR